ncbi:related to 37S ribosomal protein S17, mitochondrial [Saccharomycodes ludwigii]|uniref:Related to 37S ribosomal protein S17, mitochondrial n=2 Tax=Saccharomycodes ludwigii TaxID=36035 RepID=A0A376BBN8_9ASCO|nr:related to 37S ribosomal protein S17, mitochondrial [Saccharomycodes ludwigii]
MMKTVKVRVESKVFNNKINKYLFYRKDYLVHDEGEVSREGDLVRIEATRPLSKRKFFSIAEILRNKGQQFAAFEREAKVQVANEENVKTEAFLQKRNQSDSTLLKDVLFLQKYFANNKDKTKEDEQTFLQIKEKYGISGDMTQDSIKTLLQLDIAGLQNKLDSTREVLGNLKQQLDNLMNDDIKANDILSKNFSIENPSELKKNIKKNLLRKYILKNPELVF